MIAVDTILVSLLVLASIDGCQNKFFKNRVLFLKKQKALRFH